MSNCMATFSSSSLNLSLMYLRQVVWGSPRPRMGFEPVVELV